MIPQQIRFVNRFLKLFQVFSYLVQKRPYNNVSSAMEVSYHIEKSVSRDCNTFGKMHKAEGVETCRLTIEFRQYRIILSADTASEVRQMLSQKRR